jgi:GT2 family glycosyltransferase
MKKLAIIFTCFNREDKTEKCLDSIKVQVLKLKGMYDVQIIVCDDGSTDNTHDILTGCGLNVNIIEGGGLYWNKGMYVAMSEAVKSCFDFYLMINDDVIFYPNAIQVMLDAYQMAGRSCGITGATKGSSSNMTTYGGQLFRTERFIMPNGNLQKCNLANWNCFLADKEIIKDVGIIDPNYAHSYGDYDYSMMMQRRGYDIYVAHEFIGECDRNSKKGTFKDRTLPRSERLGRFFSPKGMSVKSGIRYSLKNRDYLGFRNLCKFLGAYLKNLILTLLF